MKNLKTLLLAAGFALTVTAASANDNLFKWADLVDACFIAKGAPTCYVNENKKGYCHTKALVDTCEREANDAMRPKRLDRTAANASQESNSSPAKQSQPREAAPKRLQRPDR